MSLVAVSAVLFSAAVMSAFDSPPYRDGQKTEITSMADFDADFMKAVEAQRTDKAIEMKKQGIDVQCVCSQWGPYGGDGYVRFCGGFPGPATCWEYKPCAYCGIEGNCCGGSGSGPGQPGGGGGGGNPPDEPY